MYALLFCAGLPWPVLLYKLTLPGMCSLFEFLREDLLLALLALLARGSCFFGAVAEVAVAVEAFDLSFWLEVAVEATEIPIYLPPSSPSRQIEFQIATSMSSSISTY